MIRPVLWLTLVLTVVGVGFGATNSLRERIRLHSRVVQRAVQVQSDDSDLGNVAPNPNPDLNVLLAKCSSVGALPSPRAIKYDVKNQIDAVVESSSKLNNDLQNKIFAQNKASEDKRREEQEKKCRAGYTSFVKFMAKHAARAAKKQQIRLAQLDNLQHAITKRHEAIDLEQMGFYGDLAEHVASVEAHRRVADAQVAEARRLRVEAQKQRISALRESTKEKFEMSEKQKEIADARQRHKDTTRRLKLFEAASKRKAVKVQKRKQLAEKRREKARARIARLRKRAANRERKRMQKRVRWVQRIQARVAKQRRKDKARKAMFERKKLLRRGIIRRRKRRYRKYKRIIRRRIIKRRKKKYRTIRRKRIIKRRVIKVVKKPAFRTVSYAPEGPSNPAASHVPPAPVEDEDEDDHYMLDKDSEHDLLMTVGEHLRQSPSHRFSTSNDTETDSTMEGDSAAPKSNTNTTAAQTNNTNVTNATANANATATTNLTTASNVTAATNNATAVRNDTVPKLNASAQAAENHKVVHVLEEYRPPLSAFDVSAAADQLNKLITPGFTPDETTAQLLATLFANALKLSQPQQAPFDPAESKEIQKMFEKAALENIQQTEKQQAESLKTVMTARARRAKVAAQKEHRAAIEAAWQDVMKRRRDLVKKWHSLLKLPEFTHPKPGSFFERARQKMHWLELTWKFQNLQHRHKRAEEEYELAKTEENQRRLEKALKREKRLEHELIVHMAKLGKKPKTIDLPKPAGARPVELHQVNTKLTSTLLDQEHLTDTSRTMVFPSYALDDRFDVLTLDGRNEKVTPIDQLMTVGRMHSSDSPETKTAELSDAQRLALQYARGAKVNF